MKPLLNWFRRGKLERVPLRSHGRKSGSVEFHADHPNQSFQGTSVSGRGDHSLRPLVSAISARLRARCRVVGGTRRGGGPQLHLAVGAGLCPRTEQALPPPFEADEQKLPHGRDIYKGQRRDKYLYRAVDSTGQTIEFLLTAKRDAAAAKRFFRKALSAPGNPVPRVINVDKNPAYPAAVEALKAEGSLPRRVRLRQCKYLNNVIEQDHRVVKKRVWLAKGYSHPCSSAVSCSDRR